MIRYEIGDDGQYGGTYDLEDSLSVCRFQCSPSVVDCSFFDKEDDEDDEREALLQSLGSRPTTAFPIVSASDFAGMLVDLNNAKTMLEKADMLEAWSAFFHDDMRGKLQQLAEAIRAKDEATARRLISAICGVA